MQLNAEDGGNRKFIMVQLPEPCDEKSEAFKAGYKNICEIGKERIRRAGEKIKAENPEAAQELDIGFRVLKLDDTNMKDVYYSADEYNQSFLDKLESNIKEDRTAVARKEPIRAVFRDSSFVNSPAKINVGEIFKMLSPDTRVKVI